MGRRERGERVLAPGEQAAVPAGEAVAPGGQVAVALDGGFTSTWSVHRGDGGDLSQPASHT